MRMPAGLHCPSSSEIVRVTGMTTSKGNLEAVWKLSGTELKKEEIEKRRRGKDNLA